MNSKEYTGKFFTWKLHGYECYSSVRNKNKVFYWFIIQTFLELVRVLRSSKVQSEVLGKFPEQLFITLMRLRRGVNNMTLAHFYDVSEYLVRTVFTTWIMLMFHHFKELRYRMFPEGKLSKKVLQKCFAFSKTFKCGMPRNYSQQGILYSSYNSHCTMKCLIAVNPNGAACFVSDLFVLMMLKFFKSAGLWNISTQMMHFWLIKDLLFNTYCFQNKPQFSFLHFWEREKSLRKKK